MMHGNRQARRGGIYVALLGASTLVMLIGLSAITAGRVYTRASVQGADAVEARRHAQSAIDLAMLWIARDGNWRADYPHVIYNGAGNDTLRWGMQRTIESGAVSVTATDIVDGSLSNYAADPVILAATGTQGDARHKLQVTAVPVTKPLELLNTCIHASGQVTVKSGKMISVRGAPLSTNNNLSLLGTVVGDVHAQSTNGGGTITGTATIPSSPKLMPDPRVWDRYKAIATALPYAGHMDRDVLTPALNTYGGGTNPEGVYYLDTLGSDLTIVNTRLHGTLLVRTGTTRKVVVDAAVFLQNHRSNYPVLMVDGNLELVYRTAEGELSEAASGVNFNPAGAPYAGATDSDTADVYPNEIRGLIHCRGALLMSQTARVRGTVVVEGTVSFEDNNEIVHDPALVNNPPIGYADVLGMRVQPGTWRQVVD